MRKGVSKNQDVNLSTGQRANGAFFLVLPLHRWDSVPFLAQSIQDLTSFAILAQ